MDILKRLFGVYALLIPLGLWAQCPLPINGSPTAIANGCPYIYTANWSNTIGGVYYKGGWTIPSGGTITARHHDNGAPGAIDSIFVVWDTPGIHNVVFTFGIVGGCVSTNTFTVNVAPGTPNNPIIFGPSHTCAFDTSIFYSPYSSALTYNWQATNGTLLLGQGTDSVMVAWGPNPPWEIMLMQNNGVCSESSTEVIGAIQPEISGPDSICPSSTATYWMGYADSSVTVNWGVTNGTLSSPNGAPSADITAGTVSPFYIWVTAANPNCAAIDSHAIRLVNPSGLAAQITGFSPHCAYAPQPLPVQWSSLNNAVANGNSVTTTGGTWGVNCAQGSEPLRDNWYLKTIITQTNTDRLLCFDDAQTCMHKTDYAMALYANGTVAIQESGGVNLLASPVMYANGDSAIVAVLNGQVHFFLNDSLLFISPTMPSLPLRFHVVTGGPGATVSNVTMGRFLMSYASVQNAGLYPSYTWTLNGNPLGSHLPYLPLAFPFQNGDIIQCEIEGCTPANTVLSNLAVIQVLDTVYSGIQVLPAQVFGCDASIQKPVWMNPTGCTFNENTFTHTGTQGWGNSGASANNLLSNGQRVETVIAETNTHRMIGLNNQDLNASWTDLDYAFYFTNTGMSQIREFGNISSPIPSMPYATGDTFAIALQADTVVYYQNGNQVYRSTVLASSPLVVDLASYTPGATLAAVSIRRGNGQDTLVPITLTAVDSAGGLNPRIEWLQNGRLVAIDTHQITLSAYTHGDLITCRLLPTEACTESSSIGVPIQLAHIIDGLVVADDPYLCQGDTAILSLHGFVGGVGWSPLQMIDTILGGTAFVTPNSTQTYWVTGYDAGGCQMEDSVTVSVHSQPNAYIMQSGDTLFAMPQGLNYQWFLNGQSTGETAPWVLPTTNGAYSVLVSDPYGCEDISMPYLFVGVNARDGDHAFILYPNPANAFIKIQPGNPVLELDYQIFDLLGRVVASGRIGSQSEAIHVGHLTAGVYAIVLGYGGEAIRRLRFVKE